MSKHLHPVEKQWTASPSSGTEQNLSERSTVGKGALARHNGKIKNEAKCKDKRFQS